MDEPTNVDEQMQRAMESAAEGRTAPRPKPSVPSLSAPRPQANVARMVSPTAREQASRQVEIKDELPAPTAFRMAFIGAGQCGGRIASAFWKLGYRRVALINTTDSDFANLPLEIPRHSFDVGGAAKDCALAAQLLKSREEEAWDLMTRAWDGGIDYALVCIGLGGGTGGGAGPALVNLARRYLDAKGLAPRVGAIVSLPTVTEGQQCARNAVTSFQQLLALKVSPLIIVDNARIHELYRPGMSKLYPTANDVVSQLFHLFNQLAAIHSEYITFDQSELGQLLDSGIVVMGSADIPQFGSPADISTRIREELANSVLAACDLKQGRKGACLFVGSSDVLDNCSIDFFDAGFSQLDRMLGSGCAEGTQTVLHRGLYAGPDPGLQVYTMISELPPPVERLRELARRGGLDLRPGGKMGVAEFLGIQD